MVAESFCYVWTIPTPKTWDKFRIPTGCWMSLPALHPNCSLNDCVDWFNVSDSAGNENIVIQGIYKYWLSLCSCFESCLWTFLRRALWTWTCFDFSLTKHTVTLCIRKNALWCCVLVCSGCVAEGLCRCEVTDGQRCVRSPWDEVAADESGFKWRGGFVSVRTHKKLSSGLWMSVDLHVESAHTDCTLTLLKAAFICSKTHTHLFFHSFCVLFIHFSHTAVMKNWSATLHSLQTLRRLSVVWSWG